MQQVSPQLHHDGDECRLNYLRGVTTRTPSPSAPAQKSLRRRRLALRRGNEGGARAKAGPVRGCRLQGPRVFLWPVELALARGDDMREGMDFLDRPNLETPHKTPTSQAKPGAKRREFPGITG